MLGGRGGQPERNRRFLSPSTWLLLEGVTQPLMVATPHYRVMSALNLRVPGPVHLLEDRGSRRGGEGWGAGLYQGEVCTAPGWPDSPQGKWYPELCVVGPTATGNLPAGNTLSSTLDKPLVPVILGIGLPV